MNALQQKTKSKPSGFKDRQPLKVIDTPTETTIFVEPHAKPRMTRRDRWNPTEAAKRYFDFRSLITEAKENHGLSLPDVLNVTFVCEMPKSLSKKKRLQMHGTAKQTRPDLSNYVKALEDCMAKEDAYIWRYENVEKIWGDVGMIVIRK